jgi:hypothetical protein
MIYHISVNAIIDVEEDRSPAPGCQCDLCVPYAKAQGQQIVHLNTPHVAEVAANHKWLTEALTKLRAKLAQGKSLCA